MRGTRTRTLFTTTLLLLVSFLLLVPTPGEATARDGDRLVVEAEVEPATVASGAALRLRATFRNAGPVPLEVFLPEHLGSIVFPRWRLVGADGRAWRPHPGSLQTMWKRGLQGEILALAPGAARAFEVRVAQVVPDVPGDQAVPADAVVLPAGTYAVTATYAHADESVPWGEEAFRRSTRPHPGLWTGEAVSAPVRLTVGPSPDPVLVLEAPEQVRPGRPYVLKVTLRNDTDAPEEVRGALVVNATSKAYGSGDAHFLLDDDRWRPAVPGAAHAIHLPAKGKRTWEIDLLAQGFGDADGLSARYRGLVEILRPGLFRLTARLVDAAGRPLAVAGLWRRMGEPVLLAGRGLALRVEPVAGPGPGVPVTVRLVNAGEETVCVPSRLAFPRCVHFSLVRPGAEERARVAVSRRASGAGRGVLPEVGARGVIDEGWSWNGDAFERSRPGDPEEVTVLPPGGELRRTFDLGALVAPDRTLGGGTWILRAYWQNLETGARLGLEPPLLTGLLVSDAIEIRGRSR